MRKTSALLLSAMAAAVSLAAAAPAMAQSKGDWTLGVGVHAVDPKSDAGDLNGAALGLGKLPTKVDSDVKPTITFEYFVADNVGIEVLGALPFKHDVSIDGVGKVGETKQLPPVVSLQYHFANSSKVTPFVGLGVNYTKFFSTDSKGALAGTKLKLEDSWGLAAHAGLDFAVSDKGALRVDMRWADIDTKVKVNGNKLGTAKIDPLVYGVAYVFKF
ncbi:OmpW family outer membrane protein [Stenotrophomonas sp.]|uniref:OmpW/AlkL family protein n=1 Tax=Stenotrophomonas sp. TaxID=69392 RepID=UPI0028AC63F5|nr:OmpW family outer membrane protein [Stenotrophomonas sp.]